MKIILKETQIKSLTESWYHGTEDSREIERAGFSSSRTKRLDYITDPIKYKEIVAKLPELRESENWDEYHRLLDEIGSLKEYYIYKTPTFLTDKYSVAKTYADLQRAFDYQNATPKVYEVDVKCNKIAKIFAIGDRFRAINTDKVREGFIDAGVGKDEIDKLLSMFNYYYSDSSKIKTDMIAAIGNWLGFDCIDVIGVLDSYHGGTIKSTMRMVLDPKNVTIKK